MAPDHWPICTPTHCINMKKSTARRRAEAREAEEYNERNVLAIDEHNLEKEWVGQAQLYYDYAIELADARLKADEAKSELEVTKAEFDTDIRADPEAYGIAKATNDVVANLVAQQPSVQKAQKAVHAANHAVKILEAMTWALEHRKKALGNLVELHLASYFAEPKQPSSEQAREAIAESNKTTIRSRGRRRRGED